MTRLTLFLLLSLALTPLLLRAQPTPAAVEATPVPELLNKAELAIQAGDLDRASIFLDMAAHVEPGNADVLNLKGSIATHRRDFKTARQFFKKAYKVDGSPNAAFNLAEMDFVEKKFRDARKAFTKLLEQNPTLPAGTLNLLHYKIFLCHLMLKDTEDAAQQLAQLQQQATQPGYDFARAAQALKSGDTRAANLAIDNARTNHGQEAVDLYSDSLTELGLLR